MNSISQKLNIVLITYNRKNELEKTLDSILASTSPIKDFEITILDNNSNDGTKELIQTYVKEYPNVKHIVNKVNIGGCANIAKALVEIPTKEYVWVLCDNDGYDWSAWSEVVQAVNSNYDMIMTRSCTLSPADIFYESAFLPAGIYKTSNITNTVAENIYDGIKTLFPHLALTAKIINDNLSIYSVTKDIVLIGKNDNQDKSYVRGNNVDEIPQSRRFIFWSVGYFNALELINDRKVRYDIIDNTRHYRKTLFEFFQSVVVKNELRFEKYFYNYVQILRMLNFKQLLLFLLAYLSIKLSFKDYSFYEMASEAEWKEYFAKINEQKYLNHLAKKLKGKKVLLYGAGLTSKVLFENYNLKDFDIIGISDKKFENTNEKFFNGIPIIKPKEICNNQFDAILFTLKLYKKIERSLKKSGIKQKSYSLIRKNNHYVVRF